MPQRSPVPPEKNTHIVEASPSEEVKSSLIPELTSSCGPSDECLSSNPKGFSGSEITEVVLVLGSSGSIAALSRVLIAWIQEKGHRSVSVDGKQIRGYSAEEVIRILSTAGDKDQNHPRE